MIIFTPFIIIFELIVFALQAAFIYGLGFVIIIAVMLGALMSKPEIIKETKFETITIMPTMVGPLPETGLICLKMDGCPISFDKMGKEHCPTCIEK